MWPILWMPRRFSLSSRLGRPYRKCTSSSVDEVFQVPAPGKLRQGRGRPLCERYPRDVNQSPSLLRLLRPFEELPYCMFVRRHRLFATALGFYVTRHFDRKLLSLHNVSSGVMDMAIAIVQEPGFVLSLRNRIREKRKVAGAGTTLDHLPLFLAFFVPGELERTLSIVLEIQGAVCLAGRDVNPLTAPIRAALHPLLDAYCSFPTHAVSGNLILNFRETLHNNRRAECRTVVPK